MVQQHLKHFFFACMAIVMLSVVATSCQDSDDNGNSGGETFDVGSYKYEYVLSGDLGKITPTAGFTGTNTKNEGCSIYDLNGNEYKGYYSVLGADSAFTSVTAYTSSDCRVLVSSLVLQNGGNGYGEVTVKCKGYFNNKLVKTGEQTVSFTPDDLSIALAFDLLDGLYLLH